MTGWEGAALFLLAFYVGAVFVTGRAWLAVWRGGASFAMLRDLTGIADRAVLRRHFGMRGRNGWYRVALAEVLARRRPAGIVLGDSAVHALFLLAVAWAIGNPGTPSASAVTLAAAAHALLVAGVAAGLLAANPRALAD